MSRYVLSGLLLATVCLSVPAFAADPITSAAPVVADDVGKESAIYKPDDKQIISLIYENDIFTGRDQYYTNGVRLAYMTSEERAPNWAKWAAKYLPFAKYGNYRISMAAGQNIYTPSDITVAVPSPNDRPYAGWLYGSLGIVSDTGTRLNTAMLTLGVVGPSSLARQTQTFVHGAIDSPKPQGWDYQLKDEPGIMLTLEQKWRNMYQFSPFGLATDFTPHVGVNLGNVNTDASAGATVRLGFDLPADYGPPRIRPSLPGSDFFVPSEKLGGYLFAGAEARGVAHNIFLDGNTFHDGGPSVDKNWVVGTFQAGVAVTYKSTRISYTHVVQTREFKGQIKPAQFGAVTMSVRF